MQHFKTRLVYTLLSNKAFTLIETAIIITVIAIIVTGSMFFIDNHLYLKKIRITEEKIQTIKTALKNHSKYPCPADLTLDIYDNNFGVAVENADGECAVNSGIFAIKEDNYYGAVPSKTLGLSLKYAFDGWGRKLSYVINKSARSFFG